MNVSGLSTRRPICTKKYVTLIGTMERTLVIDLVEKTTILISAGFLEVYVIMNLHRKAPAEEATTADLATTNDIPPTARTDQRVVETVEDR